MNNNNCNTLKNYYKRSFSKKSYIGGDTKQ